MKLLLLIALALVPEFQGMFGIRAFSFNPVEKGIEHLRKDHRLKDKNPVKLGDAGTKQRAEEHKAAATAAERYDTLMPVLSLLLLVWLSWSLRGAKEKLS